jgi:hypothetical protein
MLLVTRLLTGMVLTVGALDATLIPSVVPSEHEEQFVRGLKGHNICVQVVAGPDLSFYSFSSKCSGS